mmetsp:Transcript_47149/g.57064  ORF Transcript_47149/g.57064 Transcript_47149/m.57064 type:complete len:337 (-) Transcript_47149:57-1067(-)|eukprot:CAMPEP_0172496888 /NCGR_PEP_ID=MMETSP1066-20121228/94664_1 /TAXON_ID=671091 /ORGANISM="Coscinodiscus wailesii, Strain CCMP2513" /LENGTH=336 /DNA_ID=CAMNT_0013269425 /DNA_START=121 /DNA_END=1131 /DNA_ORIENTATION=-
MASGNPNGVGSNPLASEDTDGDSHFELQSLSSSHKASDDNLPAVHQVSPVTGNLSQNDQEDNDEGPTNEFLLVTALISFLSIATIQTFFAILGHSRALLGDSIAMFIAAFTYGFNLYAERNKHIAKSRREELLLEIVPPIISVTTLGVISAFITYEAIVHLLVIRHSHKGPKPNLRLMFGFSLANLFMDVFNVCCFARAKHAMGFSVEQEEGKEGAGDDSVHLISAGKESTNTGVGEGQVNLNMCSAYTNIVADTLRSLAVMFAAAVAWTTDVDAKEADSAAAIIVSIIIVFSLVPLYRGIRLNMEELRMLRLKGDRDLEFQAAQEESGGRIKTVD